MMVIADGCLVAEPEAKPADERAAFHSQVFYLNHFNGIKFAMDHEIRLRIKKKKKQKEGKNEKRLGRTFVLERRSS